jgi:Ca-activated chloride channel family protein
MKRAKLRNFLLVTVLIIATGVAMAYSSGTLGVFSSNRPDANVLPHTGDAGVLTVSGHLIQDKVLQGSEGKVGLNITLQAEEITPMEGGDHRNVDMVIVLDRSGSMKGRKIDDARRAVLELLSNLSARDRFALVTYSDGVHIATDLRNVTDDNRLLMESAVNSVRAGGGTNLGAGLQAGLDLLISPGSRENAAKVILISDGLANKGTTDVKSLAGMAAIAVKKEFVVSTVGVGVEFNEHLMTTIADHGTGSYYYLENPAAFAEVFQKEFYTGRTAAVTGVKIQVPADGGIILADAAGYPITFQNNQMIVHPGNLHSGQTRKLFLTLRVPTDSKKTFELENIAISYHYDNRLYETTLDQSFEIACINDRKKVYSSIDRTSWSEKVIREDFNRLKQEVAADIKAGKMQTALKKIDKYHTEQKAANEVVGSANVAENLDKDLEALKIFVDETFQGSPAAVEKQQKSNAKALQYEGYNGRRQ